MHYRPEADRLLLRVNSNSGQQFSVWFTRRLCARLWPQLVNIVTRVGVAQAVPRASRDATVMPEAQAMLAQVARESALRESDFKTPFDTQASVHPLGPEPMLAVEVQLTPMPDGHLRLLILDIDKRNLQLQLTAQLAVAVQELTAQALRDADWGLEIEAAAATAADAAPPSTLLN